MVADQNHKVRPTEEVQPGVVAVIPQAGKLLVIRRSRWVRAPRAYCFPGGGIEAGEDSATALIREMREELAVSVQPVRQLWQSTTPWGVPLTWWLSELEPSARLRPAPSEVESVHWFEPRELQGLAGLLESNLHFLTAWHNREFELQV